MKFTFHGGAQTVTGSAFLVSINGTTLLLECGVFQGKRADMYEKNQNFPFDPQKIDAVVLSHAHMDHSGNLPNLIKKGYKKSIYATPPTTDLCKIMLRDSAHLQEMDSFFVNKIRAKQKLPPIHPLYTMQDAEAAMDYFVNLEYEKTVTLAKGVDLRFHDAGHILGSAGVMLEIHENGKEYRVGFTGDLGRKDIPILRDPNALRDLDVLIMESTYGNRTHASAADAEEELADAIRSTSRLGGKIIIPSFAVGRTQLLVYMLHKLFDQDRIPDMPIYVDSPLACKATDVFRDHTECFDREANRIFLSDGSDPFGFSRLTYIHDVEESKRLNRLSYPHIIISSSGMAEGGRILHHLRNNIEDHRNLILFVGYAAKETLARKIMDGDEKVKIFGEEHRVKAQVRVMDHFSAHGDRRDLLDYVEYSPPNRLKNIFLVHGEHDQAIPLKDALRSKGYESVHYPGPGEEYVI